MSARPSRTASKVPGAATTPLGRMLHFMRPVLSFSSMSHQFFCTVDRVWVGGSQLDTVNTVCAETRPLDSNVVDKAAANTWRSLGFLFSRLTRIRRPSGWLIALVVMPVGLWGIGVGVAGGLAYNSEKARPFVFWKCSVLLCVRAVRRWVGHTIR